MNKKPKSPEVKKPKSPEVKKPKKPKKPKNDPDDIAAEALALANEHKELTLVVENGTEANELMLEVHKQWAKLEKTRKWLKEPSLEAGRRIDNLMRPALTVLADAKATLKAYINAEIKREREAKQAALAASLAVRHEPAAPATPAADDEAFSFGDGLDIALAMPVTVAKTRRVRIIEVPQPDLLPRKYLVPDTAAIKAAVDSGYTPPGVTVRFEDQVSA